MSSATGSESPLVAVSCEESLAEAVTAACWVLGATGTAEIAHGPGRVRILAGFDAAVGGPSVDELASELRTRIPTAEVEVIDPVEPTWRHHFVPPRAGPFRIRFPEHATTGDAVDLCIEPGGAFGSGSHQSTRLALAALAELDLAGRAVADIGTGTGVLAIGAALLGAAPVHAVDTDPESIELAQVNARSNHVTIRARSGSVGDLDRDFDVVVANLTALTQRDLATAIGDHTEPGGLVVLSGMLIEQVASVRALYPRSRLLRIAGEGRWACVVLEKDTATPATDRGRGHRDA